ncbi:MAG: hypothetical protein Q7S43_01845 [bacterium]|nr:hypothetical protein [bacterium]
MELSIKEKAGIDDVARIYEGLHLTESFIRNLATDSDGIAPDFLEEADRHFGFCDQCRKKKEEFLPLG